MLKEVNKGEVDEESKGPGRFWRTVCMYTSGPCGLSRALHCRVRHKKAMQILGRKGILCIPLVAVYLV